MVLSAHNGATKANATYGKRSKPSRLGLATAIKTTTTAKPTKQSIHTSSPIAVSSSEGEEETRGSMVNLVNISKRQTPSKTLEPTSTNRQVKASTDKVHPSSSSSPPAESRPLDKPTMASSIAQPPPRQASVAARQRTTTMLRDEAESLAKAKDRPAKQQQQREREQPKKSLQKQSSDSHAQREQQVTRSPLKQSSDPNAQREHQVERPPLKQPLEPHLETKQRNHKSTETQTQPLASTPPILKKKVLAVETWREDEAKAVTEKLQQLRIASDINKEEVVSAPAASTNAAPAVKEIDQSVYDYARLLKTCGQRAPAVFSSCIEELIGASGSIHKAGEASYSEVFRVFQPSASPTILKIIPLEKPQTKPAGSLSSRRHRSRPRDGSTGIGEIVTNSSCADVKREIDITTVLGQSSSTHTSARYVKLRSAHVVRGSYPATLLDAWDAYAADRSKGAENARPDDKIYSSSDLFCVLCISDGGADLEHVRLTTWTQAAAVFAQVVELLAAGEEKCEFEHRDLHWGNILVSFRSSSGGGAASGSNATSFSQLLSFASSSIKTTLIDFTLSRLQHQVNHVKPVSAGGALPKETVRTKTLYCDLSIDASLFSGDADVDYQFEVYRQMREFSVRARCEAARKVSGEQGTEDGCEANWKAFTPATNLLWCLYLIRKLLHEKDLPKLSSSTGKTSKSLAPNEKLHYDRLTRLEVQLESVVRDLVGGKQVRFKNHNKTPDVSVKSTRELRDRMRKEWR